MNDHETLEEGYRAVIAAARAVTAEIERETQAVKDQKRQSNQLNRRAGAYLVLGAMLLLAQCVLLALQLAVSTR